MFIKYVLKTCIHNDFDAGSNWAIPAHRGSSSQQDGHTVTELATHTTLQPANQKRPAPASPQPLASHSQGAGIGRVQGLRCNFLGLMILVSIAVQASRREAGAAGDETRTTSTKTLHLHFVHKRGIGVKRLVKECTAQLGARLAGSRTSAPFQMDRDKHSDESDEHDDDAPALRSGDMDLHIDESDEHNDHAHALRLLDKDKHNDEPDRHDDDHCDEHGKHDTKHCIGHEEEHSTCTDSQWLLALESALRTKRSHHISTFSWEGEQRTNRI